MVLLKLYLDERSAPARSVLMTAEALDIKLELSYIDIVKKEQLSGEFIKINPQHKIPTLDDNGYILWNSHAINAYLVDKYAKDDSLYPKDPQKRGIVNQRLFFNEGVFFNAMFEAGEPILFQGAKTVPEDKKEAVYRCYELLDFFLKDSPWVAAENVTIADFNILTCIEYVNYLVPFEQKKYPRLAEWFERAKSLPCYRVTESGFKECKKLLESLLAQ